ncbi:MAG: hypothetical protein XD87_0071 [candidate division WS6 bacterium 36_33]|uniref:Uncharacterized protein n=1 Tax=candidate division WS6 bacterium 36_33 TaxID=1641388 RepID=A0A101GZK8_9BACT|nr:MAG: hypothetical protein XD87_0071 [candidate division WS6 bacterium 36_33]
MELLLKTGAAAGAMSLGFKANKGESTPNILKSTTKKVEASPSENIFTPKMIKEVPVYGFNEKIDNLDKIQTFYDQLDKEYEEANGVEIHNKYKQRKELLKPDERYLEVVVFKSAYDSFQKRERETGVDFVEWVKMHVDAMNLCFSNAKPHSDLKAVLRRIVILEEGTLDPIFDMNKYLEGNAAFGPDFAYNKHFVFNKKSAFDTDESWVVGSDYRVNTRENINNYKGGYFWSTHSANGKIYFANPPGGRTKERIRVYPDRGSNLTGKQGVWMDFGMTHEWLHYLFNLPDEYGYDVHSNGEAKAVISTGSFSEPYLSPYLSILSQNHIDKKLRDPTLEGCGVGYTIFNIPEKVQITTDENVKMQEMRTIRVQQEKQSYFPEEPDYIATENSINTSKDDLIKNKAHALELSLIQNGAKKKLYVPYLAFHMSKLKMKETAKYNIELLDEIQDKVQHVAIVDQGDIEPLTKERKRVHNQHLVAKMDIDGTNTSYIWFQ